MNTNQLSRKENSFYVQLAEAISEKLYHEIRNRRNRALETWQKTDEYAMLSNFDDEIDTLNEAIKTKIFDGRYKRRRQAIYNILLEKYPDFRCNRSAHNLAYRIKCALDSKIRDEQESKWIRERELIIGILMLTKDIKSKTFEQLYTEVKKQLVNNG